MKKDVSVIPQNPTNKEIVEALEATTRAMCNLSAIWGNANEAQLVALDNGVYPFDQDFDTVMHNMVHWAMEVKDALGKK